MSSERADQPATPDNAYHAPFPGGNGVPGQVLAAQRDAMGWTVEQVADQLKLAVRQVIALEAGDYASLPSPAVTRGFVRAYAKLMKLDPAPLVAQIAIETVPTVDNTSHSARRAAPTSFSESRFPNHNKRAKLPLGMIAAVVVVVAAGAAAWKFGLIPMGQRAEHADAASASVALPASATATATGDPTAPSATTETLQNPAVPLISVPGASTPAAPAPAAAANAPAAGAPATAATPTVTAPATPAAAATAAPAPAAAPTAAGPNALVLNVRQDSWVEVRPTKGAPLISRLVKAGSVETVNVDGPVRVVVGNPTGVSVTLLGEPVALPTVPGKTISRVNLQ